MSLTSLDGLLPATFKKLLAGELPSLQSAHISEGMAAGCGYRNNAAYLTDLKGAGPIRFVPVERVDASAMVSRLIAIGAVGDGSIEVEIRSVLSRIHAHVQGDIVPLGPKSSIVGTSASGTGSADVDGPDHRIVQVLRDALDDDSEAVIRPQSCRNVHEFFVRAVVAALKSSKGQEPIKISDLVRSARIENVFAMYQSSELPQGLRENVVNYLMCLPDFDAEETEPTDALVEQHRMFEDAFIGAVKAIERDFQAGSPYAIQPFHYDDAVDALWANLDYNGRKDRDMWAARGRQFTEALVAACRWVARPGMLHISDLSEAAALESFMLLADPNAYPGMPRKVREDVVRYLNGLPGFRLGSPHQRDIPIAQHNHVLDGFFPALDSVSRSRPKSISGVRSSKSPFLAPPSIFDGFGDDRLAKIGANLHASVHNSKASGGEMQRAGRLVGVLLCGMRALHPDGNVDVAVCKRIVDLEHLIVLERSTMNETLARLIGEYLDLLPRDASLRGSRDTGALRFEHDIAERILLKDMARRSLSQLVRH